MKARRTPFVPFENLTWDAQVSYLGEGSFGVVRRHTCDIPTLGKRDVAIKEVSLKTSPRAARKFKLELDVMKFIHRHGPVRGIPCLYGYNISSMVLVLEYFPSESLECILTRGSVESAFAFSILDQLVTVLVYLKGRGIAHLDLKPANILVSMKTTEIKLIDFDICRYNVGSFDMGIINEGSPLYMSPQSLLDEPTGYFVAQVWTLGIIFYEMLYGEPPYTPRTIYELKLEIVRLFYGVDYTFGNHPEDECWVLRHTLRYRPEARASMETIRKYLDFAKTKKAITTMMRPEENPSTNTMDCTN
jgi:serine/threonine protein kinase